MRNLWCLRNTAQVRTAWNNFFFAIHLQKILHTGKEIFEKVDFFFQEYQLSWTDCVSV